MNLLTETIQYGYKEQSSCVDALRAVDNFLKDNKKGELLLMDLTKAFDSINRDLLWTALFRKGLPLELIGMLMEGHRETKLQVKNKGTYGDPVETNIGVFQGAAFSALGFIIYLCDMIDDFQALNDLEKVNNVYTQLPTEETRQKIAKHRVYRQAGITQLPALPRLEEFTRKSIQINMQKHIKEKLSNYEETVQKLNTELTMEQDSIYLNNLGKGETEQSEGRGN